jgi:hypothetical protein
MSHQKGVANARAVEDASPIVSNMVPEEKWREKDMVSIFSSGSCDIVKLKHLFFPHTQVLDMLLNR